MQIATLNYQYNPKDNVNGDGRAQVRHRKILTTITNPQKKTKPRESLHSDLTIHSNGQLPPIRKSIQHRGSIRVRGSSLTSLKLGERSGDSLPYRSRSHSRQSIKSDNADGTGRSVTPTGTLRPISKLIRTKFGHPIKLRPADFYAPDKSEIELRIREDSFVNDSVRSANHNRRSSIIPHYEALDDPHLRQFFQSPIVLDILRKTLKVEANNSFKQDERTLKTPKIVQRSKSSDLYDKRNDDYHRIVSKSSSGYGKLNGYDCIPSYSPARHYYNRSNTTDPTPSSSQRWSTIESRLNHSTTQEKYQASGNTSLASIPINNSNQLQNQQNKKKLRKYEKFKQLHVIATSSPLRHPLRQLVQATTSNIESSSTTKTTSDTPEQQNESAIVSNVPQD